MNLLQLFEAESRFVLYFNGKPASHYATEAEAKRIADSIKAKHPDVKIEIKNEMREDAADHQVDEVLAPDQLSKLQSIKSQLPKAGGQKPSVPTDADRAEADAWLAGLKGGTPAAPAAAGEAPLNFDRPGRPRSTSYSELQTKIAKLKNIKGILKSISKVEPKATRAANKVGGSEEIETKSQMMADLINNLNISYTSEQELDSIERRMGEYLQQLTAKSAAWTRPNRANKSGAVTIIKPGQGDVEEGRAIKPVADNAAAAAKLYQYVSRNLTDLASMASFHEDRDEGYHDAKLDGLFKLPDGKPIYVIFGGSSLVLIQNTLFIPVQMYYQYRGFLRRESFLPNVKKALENPKNSWEDVSRSSEGNLNEVTGDLPFDTMLSKIVAGGNLQTLAAKIVAKIKKFPQYRVPDDDRDRDDFDWPNGYPDGHFFGDDIWIDDSFNSIMEKWKSLGPDKFADENQELSFKPSMQSSNDYTNYWNGVLELLRRLESIPGAEEQLAKMVWHGLFSGSVEQGITDIGKKGVAEGIGDDDGENKDYALALAQYGMKVLQGMEKICQQIDALPEPKKSNLLGKLTDVEFAQSGELVQYVIDKLGLKIDDFMEFQDAWEEEDGEPFYTWIYEWIAGRWDEFVAPWKKFTMKVLQGRGLGPTLHEAGVSEGAKVDRMVKHIASSEKATGKSAKDAENIAWATVNKRGMLANKNKKKVSEETKISADIRAKNRAVVKKLKGKETDIDEGWKSKLAGAALAGAAALGGGGASAADVNDPSWSNSGYDSHIKADSSLTQTTSADGASSPKVSKDLQRRISDVTGPNAEGQYRVTVTQNGKLASQYVTKTPPPGWMVKEDNLSDMRETKTAWLTPGKFSEEENQNANGEDESTRYLKQLRMRNPAAKSNLSALAFDYRQAQDRDHREINRLDHENDREDADIDRLDVENDHEDHEINALKRTLDQLISNRNSK